MKAVVQRVGKCELFVGGKLTASIGRGLCVYLGVARGDDEETALYLAGKIARLRVFEDGAGKMNLSLIDVGGTALVVSQFTLMANTSRGNRPDFVAAEAPERAKALYERFCEALQAQGPAVFTGVFGADMQIKQDNDGPVTILFERTPETLNRLF